MSDFDACPIPARGGDNEFTVIRRLVQANRIAVVGLSDHPGRPSYGVASYLLDVGKEIIPVNPNHNHVLGLTCYSSLEHVPGPIDLVNIFRRPEFCPEIVRQAILIRAKGVWLQSGIRSAEARQLARQAGLDYVEDRCLMVEHMHAR